MKLLLDVGNQRCKRAVYDGHAVSCYPAIDADSALKDYIPDNLLNGEVEITEVWIASVREQTFNNALKEMIQKSLQRTPVFAEVKRSLCGCTTRYDSRSLGIDRFVGLIGAWQSFGQACFIIDCGTAVTIDALDAQGVHQGGLIIPGLTMMKSALHQNTARLELGVGKNVLFPGNTDDAIDSGCRRLLSTTIESALQDMRFTDTDLYVVTGGDGAWFAQRDKKFIYREALILEGLAAVADSAEKQ